MYLDKTSPIYLPLNMHRHTIIVIIPLLYNDGSANFAHGSTSYVLHTNDTHPLRVRNLIAKDLCDLLERLALCLGEDEEKARGGDGVTDEKNDIVPPAYAVESFWGELVE